MMSNSSYALRGNRLHGRRKEAWSLHHTKYCISIDRNMTRGPVGQEMAAPLSVASNYRFDPGKIYGHQRAQAPLVVEIGSGLGETITHAAVAHPDRNYLAIEVFTPGLASTILRLEQLSRTQGHGTPLPNVRLAHADAAEFLATAFNGRSIDELWVFFPDPWPKRRHHKRRLLSAKFLDLVARRLKPGGVLRLASDWDHYALSMRELLDADSRFTNQHPGAHAGGVFHVSGTKGRPGGAGTQEAPLADDITQIDAVGGWAPRFTDRPLTSYEKKALSAGRLVHDLCYQANHAEAKTSQEAKAQG